MTMLMQKPRDELQQAEHGLPRVNQVPMLHPSGGSIYSQEEERFLGPWQRTRQRFLAPIAFALSRLGISANMLSLISVILGLGFCLLAPVNFVLAFWLLVASIVCDGLDGVEARLTRTNSARGSFTDMFCAQVVVALSVAGLTWKGLIHPVLALLFVYVYTALVTFLILHQTLGVSSKGIIRPSRMLLYAAVALYVFFHINLLNGLLLVYLLALPLLLLS